MFYFKEVMSYEQKIKAFGVVRYVFGFLLLLSALGRLGSAHVVTSGYIATDFRLATDATSVILGLFEVGMAIYIALGLKWQLGYWIYGVYLIAMNTYFHAFWGVEPQLEFEQQILFFKTLSISLGVLGFGFAQSVISDSINAKHHG